MTRWASTRLRRPMESEATSAAYYASGSELCPCHFPVLEGKHRWNHSVSLKKQWYRWVGMLPDARNGFSFSAFYREAFPEASSYWAAVNARTRRALLWRSMEIVYFAGAFILLSALIYRSLHTRYRNGCQRKVSDQIVRDRYEHTIN
jgi:hypothetical protein